MDLFVINLKKLIFAVIKIANENLHGFIPVALLSDKKTIESLDRCKLVLAEKQ